jgi:ATP-dependent Clp protease adaptor protein ClpS
MPTKIKNSTITKEKIDIKEPSLYKVILHNDDYTTMEFVIYVLMVVFNKSQDNAYNIMMSVHEQGTGICGVFPHAIAETKVRQVQQLAEEDEFPLKCTMEKE